MLNVQVTAYGRQTVPDKKVWLGANGGARGRGAEIDRREREDRGA